MEEELVKKIYILGNGFDLHHYFPTRYTDFINMMKFCISIKTELEIHPVENLEELLQKYIQANPKDEQFKNYCQFYDEQLSKIHIDCRYLKELLDNLEQNCWYKCIIAQMNQSQNNWVDFEHIIQNVIYCFKLIFDLNYIVYEKEINLYQLTQIFSELFMLNSGFFVKTEYLILPLLRSQHVIDKDKVLQYLFSQLNLFKKALSFYIFIFVNSVKKDNRDKNLNMIKDSDLIITFNYTKIYNNYNLKSAIHIHGKINDINSEDYVLGIQSSDEDDYHDKQIPDLTFVEFKKFFQRQIYQCDQMPCLTINDNNIELFILGHSLDITDKDILLPLINNCSKLTIFYTNQEDKKSHLKNLIKLLGKEEYEKLNEEQVLSFNKLKEIPINSDL